MTKMASKATGVIIAAVTSFAVVAPQAAFAAEPSNPAAISASSNLSAADAYNLEIVSKYINGSGNKWSFDEAGAVAAGADAKWVASFGTAFRQAQARVQQVAGTPSGSRVAAQPGTASDSMQPMWGPPWLACAVSIASLVGASVGVVVAGMATGGLAWALAAYGLSGYGAISSCYDENGKPVI